MEETSNHPSNPKKEKTNSEQPNIDPNNEFPIKIELTLDDTRDERCYIELNKKDVEQEIMKHLTDMEVRRVTNDPVKIIMKDLDTNSEHEVSFGYYKSMDQYFLEGLWGYNFVKRRDLCAGDVVGIKFKYNQKLHQSSKLFFRVLKNSLDEDMQYDICQ